MSPTSPPLLVFEYVLTHPGMFLDTQRSWTVYLQSEKKKVRRKVLVSDHLGRSSYPTPNPTPAEARASFSVASQGQGTYGAGLA